jgi:hypothetical protein
MSRTGHFCLSLKGALRHSRTLRALAGDNGLTVAELKDRFRAMLRDGIEVIPVGPRCDNFDDRRGCLGHVGDEEAASIARAWAE